MIPNARCCRHAKKERQVCSEVRCRRLTSSRACPLPPSRISLSECGLVSLNNEATCWQLIARACRVRALLQPGMGQWCDAAAWPTCCCRDILICGSSCRCTNRPAAGCLEAQRAGRQRRGAGNNWSRQHPAAHGGCGGRRQHDHVGHAQRQIPVAGARHERVQRARASTTLGCVGPVLEESVQVAFGPAASTCLAS